MNTQIKQEGLVWDLPTRLFHWILVLCFAGAWLTAESEVWKLWHVSFGYTMAVLLAFRLVWGVAGTRYARFRQFVKGPAAIKSQLISYVSGKPEHHVGHNPVGALAIVAMLVLIGATVASGYANYEGIGGEAFEEIHEAMANILMGLVLVHVGAVLAIGLVFKKNLVKSMLTGKKAIYAGEAISGAWRSVAIVLLGLVVSVWWLMFR